MGRTSHLLPPAALVMLLLPALALAEAAAAGPSTVHLKHGSRIRGEILKQDAERVFVDLGYTVLGIPGDEILRIVQDGAPAQATGQAHIIGGLFTIDPARPELPVKENVARCGEAVVQVRTSVGLGSGFIIHADGYLLTNHHVIAGERELTVTMFRQGDQELRRIPFEDVRIVASSPHLDLALLKIEDAGRGDLPVVPLGDSLALFQGQPVFAIGSPLGLERSVSEGIVSLRNRALGGHIFIQSTAQINPGNSGGPLFNLQGEVVGVNNMKISAEGVEGLGFAVPSATVKSFLDNRDAFAFDPRNPNAGYRYNRPPRVAPEPAAALESDS